MRHLTRVLALAIAASGALAQTYPPAPKDGTVETYHGVKVPDPYRPLEDPDAAASRTWIDAQNKLTQAYLAGVEQRGDIQKRLTTLWDFERYGIPFKEGGKYFYSKNDGLQNQSVHYVCDSLEGEPRVLLDPNTLSADGTVALAGMAINEQGTHMAYGLAEAGSDWNTWKVRDIATGKDLADVIKWVKFSGASWTKDGKGFFYSRYDEPKGDELTAVNYFQKVYFHKLGDDQSKDVLVYERKDQKEWGFGAGVTEDGTYLTMGVWQGTDPKNRFFFRTLGAGADPLAGAGPVVELLNEFDAEYSFIGNDGPVFWFKTDLNAPRGRVIAIDTRNPDRAKWVELIPQQAETLTGASVVGDMIFANYLKDARTQVRVHDLSGKLVREVAFPGIGTAGGFGGKRADTETFYSFSGFTTPASVFRYDVKSGATSVFRAPKVDFNPADYTTTQIFYNSKDGTRVPMFITHKKGIVLDGTNPTLLYGYGGFSIPVTPSFSVSNLVWMEMGGVYAVANIRGGGEYGEEWHLAGTKTQKQNVFDDFIAAAEWLIKEKYTQPKKLAILGGSNGGLLIGACMTQRPELFGACLPAVGVLDMLRFHKFTIGWAWTSDYGSSESEDASEFKALLAYSPLHNVKKGACYPPTMIMTGDHDDRVVPAHSFKFAAAVQEAQGCDNPILIRIDVRAGHGAGKPTAKVIEQVADQWAFLVRALNMKPAGAESESSTVSQ